MSSAWSLVIARLAAVIGAALVAGLLFGGPLWWLLGALAGLLAWHLYHVYRLQRWLVARKGAQPRDAYGVWGEIYSHLYRLRRRNRRRKKQLARLLNEYRRSTAAMPDAAVVLGASDEIMWINAAAIELLGLSKADRGQRIDNFLREPVFVHYLREGNFEEPVRMVSPFEPRRHLSVRIIPYGHEQRLLIAKDVTREIRLEKVRRDFVGNASHELRSPLTVISGYLDNLMDDQEMPVSWRQPVAEMAAQAARMRSIIEDLLTLSRLEAADSRAPRERVDVAGMLALIRKDALAATRAQLKVELEVECEAVLLGAESELYSAFANIVNNALKYTPAGGQVTIRFSCDENAARVSVADTGIGIPEEAIPRLTERFYRVHKGRERSRGGTGLGLAIVKHVLQRHEAVLEIESEVGRGSTFTCRFPAARAAAADGRCAGATGTLDDAGEPAG